MISTAPLSHAAAFVLTASAVFALLLAANLQMRFRRAEPGNAVCLYLPLRQLRPQGAAIRRKFYIAVALGIVLAIVAALIAQTLPRQSFSPSTLLVHRGSA
jgi:hypothetical protein